MNLSIFYVSIAVIKFKINSLIEVRMFYITMKISEYIILMRGNV